MSGSQFNVHPRAIPVPVWSRHRPTHKQLIALFQHSLDNRVLGGRRRHVGTAFRSIVYSYPAFA